MKFIAPLITVSLGAILFSFDIIRILELLVFGIGAAVLLFVWPHGTDREG